eukprot:183108_1
MDRLKRLSTKFVSSTDYSYFGSPDDPELIFEIIQTLSKSSFLTTYKALDKRDEQIVELKIVLMDDNSNSKYDLYDNLHIQSFQNVIELLKSRTKSSYFASFKGLWLENNQIWIASEFCAGGSIENIIQNKESPLHEQQIAVVMKNVLKGLEYIHKHKVIHRSIKSQYICIDDKGKCKISNLGVSNIMDELIGRGKIIMDNPYWTSPELIADSSSNKNDNNISCMTDIWSLGITAIEMACGKVPYGNKTSLQFVWHISNAEPPKLENKINQFSKEFHDFVRLCLVKDPSQRYTATKLLKHSWIKQCKLKTIFGDEIDTHYEDEIHKQTIEEKVDIESDDDDISKKKIKNYALSPDAPKKSTMLTDADDEQSELSTNDQINISIFDRFMPKLKLTNSKNKITVQPITFDKTKKLKRSKTPIVSSASNYNNDSKQKYPFTPLILSYKNPNISLSVVDVSFKNPDVDVVVNTDEEHDSNDDMSDKNGYKKHKKMPNIIGSYKIIEELKRDEFAQKVICQGFDIRTCDHVLMKVYNTSKSLRKNTCFMALTPRRKYIENEIRILSDISKHKHMIQYVEMVENDEYMCIIMEFVQNRTLKSILDESDKAISHKFMCQYLIQVLEGLEFLHDTHNIIHRNIKAENIYLTTGCIIKLSGFDAAVIVEEYDCDIDDIMDNILLKSPYWSSPEIVEKRLKINPSTDIWSIGCLTIELLTNKPPYYDLKPMNAQNAIIKDELPPIPNGNKLFTDFIHKCFNKDGLSRICANKLKTHSFLHSDMDEKQNINNPSNKNHFREYSTKMGMILKSIGEDTESTLVSFEETIDFDEKETYYSNLKHVRERTIGSVKSKCNDSSFDFGNMNMVLKLSDTSSNTSNTSLHTISVCICGHNLETIDEYKKPFVCHQCFKVISKNNCMLQCGDNKCKFKQEYGYKICDNCDNKLDW